MAYLLPLRPWFSPDLRVFSPEGPQRLRILVIGETPLLHFDAASASHFLRDALLLTSHADHEPLSVGTSPGSFGPTAYPD